MLGHDWIDTKWGKMLAIFELERPAFVRLWLPDGPVKEQLKAARSVYGVSLIKAELPSKLRPWAKKITSYFEGRKVNFQNIPIDLSAQTPFRQSVYTALLQIPYGKTSNYGEIANAIDSRGFQAVGSAVGNNPLPLVIPCHRVLGSGRSPGGFTSAGGLKTKERLLALEGSELYRKTSLSFFDRDFDLELATKEFGRLAPAFKKIIKVAPRFDPGKSRSEDPQRALAKSVVYQQLSGAAAATIWGRLCESAGENLDGVLELSESQLRTIGLSGNKVRALTELVERDIPNLSDFKKMSDLEVVREVSSYRGLGVWSAQMFLIFNLGRMDIFAPLDLGLQKGRAKILNCDFSKDVKTLEAWANNYAPWRTLLSWYLWRSLDF